MTLEQAVSTVLLALITTSVPLVIAWILNRRGQNKKLELEEAAVGVDISAEQRLAFVELLRELRAAAAASAASASASQASAAAALVQLEAGKAERAELIEIVRENGAKFDALRDLFQRVVTASSYVLSPAELEELERTKPRPLPDFARRRPRST